METSSQAEARIHLIQVGFTLYSIMHCIYIGNENALHLDLKLFYVRILLDSDSDRQDSNATLNLQDYFHCAFAGSSSQE